MKPMKHKRPIHNRKGQIGIIFFFIVILTILIIGFIAVVSSGILNYVGDQLTPILTSLGSVNISDTTSANLSAAASYTITPLNTLVQNLGWILGFGYVAALLFSVIFVIAYESNPSPVFIGLYFIFMIFILLGTIVISNMYQDLYSSDDQMGAQLREQTLLSWMILYSPAVMLLIMVLAGIYLFARPPETQGGFGL